MLADVETEPRQAADDAEAIHGSNTDATDTIGPMRCRETACREARDAADCVLVLVDVETLSRCCEPGGAKDGDEARSSDTAKGCGDAIGVCGASLFLVQSNKVCSLAKLSFSAMCMSVSALNNAVGAVMTVAQLGDVETTAGDALVEAGAAETTELKNMSTLAANDCLSSSKSIWVLLAVGTGLDGTSGHVNDAASAAL